MGRARPLTSNQFFGMLALVAFFPSFPGYFGLALVSFIPVVFAAYALFSIYRSEYWNVNSVAYWIFGLYLTLLLISLTRSTESLIANDFIEIGKPLFFFLTYAYFHNKFSGATRDQMCGYVDRLMLLLIIAAVWGVLEALVPAFDRASAFLFKGGRSAVQGKAVFSFISPYTFASILVLPLGYSMLRFGTGLKGGRYFFLTVLFLLALLFTQSRSVFLAFAISGSTFLLFVATRPWVPNVMRYRTILACLAGLLVVGFPTAVVVVRDQLPYLYSGLKIVFEQLMEGDVISFIFSTPSISNRYEQLVQVLEYHGGVPFIGAGIAKSLIYPESFYSLYLLRVGLLGLLLHLLIIGFALMRVLAFSRILARDHKELSVFFLALGLYFFSLPFSYFSSALNDQIRTGFIFYMLLALVFSFNTRGTEK